MNSCQCAHQYNIHLSLIRSVITPHPNATKRNAKFPFTKSAIPSLLGIVRCVAEDGLFCLGDEGGKAIFEGLAVLVGGMLGEAVESSS